MNYPGKIKAPGKTMLKVTGILLIIFNVIGIFGTLSIISTTDTWLWMFGGEGMRGTWNFIYSISLLLSLSGVAVGIMGVALCNKIEKGIILFVIAIILIVTTVIFNIIYTIIINSFGSGFSVNFHVGLGFSTSISIPDILLPALYVVGALKNKKAHETVPYLRQQGPHGP